MDKSGVEDVLKLIAGKLFEDFKSSYVVGDYYELNVEFLSNAICNARTDIERVASYHSDTGASLYRQVAYVAKWIADIKPIQVGVFPLNLTNEHHLNLQRINSSFAVFFVEHSLLTTKSLSTELLIDLRYCFEFRHTTTAEAIALMLKHYQPKPV